MYVQSVVSSAPVADHAAPRSFRHGGRTAWPLIAVCAAYTLAQLLFVLPGTGLGWDETVYVSQVGGAPAAYFSAPRARGISYLVAPLVSVSTSTTALRVYLAVLSGAGLLAALWVWRRLLPMSVLAWAGGLFAGLWITVYYGPQAMPNLWVAFGSLAAVGFFLRAVRARRPGPWAALAPRPPLVDRTALPGLACALAVVALMRPPDAAWLVLPLLLAAALVPGWRRPAVLLAVVAGAALGAAPWIVEAYTQYGGLLTRLDRASAIQGGMGWHSALWDHVRSLQGRALCRPCGLRWRHPQTAVWWFALPPAVVAGLVSAVRSGRRDSAVLPVLTALSMAVPYLFLMGYAAPRFLLPAYALLALPVAEGLRAGFARAFPDRAARPWGRRPGPAPRHLIAPALVAVLVAHLAVQYEVLGDASERGRHFSAHLRETAAELHRAGVRPPCMVTGETAVPVAYYAGCTSLQSSGHDASLTDARLRKQGLGEPTAVLVRGRRHGPPRWARQWPVLRLPLRRHRAYVTPRAGAGSSGRGQAGGVRRDGGAGDRPETSGFRFGAPPRFGPAPPGSRPGFAASAAARTTLLRAAGAPADPGPQDADTFTLSRSVPGAAGPSATRSVSLDCSPEPAGTHPLPEAACSRIAAAKGDFGALPVGAGAGCTDPAAPVTALATGVWHGAPVNWKRTFRNRCALERDTGAVFRF